MKKILAMVLSLALVATLAISGTVAYLTDDESAVNVMTVGKVDIVLHEEQRETDKEGHMEPNNDLVEFVDGKNLMPAVGSAQGDKDKWGMPQVKNYVDKIVRVENSGESPAYVRVYIGIPAALENDDASKNVLHWNFGNRFDPTEQNAYGSGAWSTEYLADFVTGATTYKDYGYTEVGTQTIKTDKGDELLYNIYCFTKIAPLPAEDDSTTSREDDMTAATLVGFYLDGKVDYDDKTDAYYMGEKVEGNRITVTGVGDGATSFNFHNDLYIPVFAQAVQSEGFGSAKEAFDAAFGANYSNPWADQTMEEDRIPAEGTAASNVNELKTLIEKASSGDVITLSKNISIDSTERISVPAGVSINGNGKTLTNVMFDIEAANNTIKNTNFVGTVGTDGGQTMILAYYGDNAGVCNLTVKNCSFSGRYRNAIQYDTKVDGSYVTIDGCTFSAEDCVSPVRINNKSDVTNITVTVTNNSFADIDTYDANYGAAKITVAAGAVTKYSGNIPVGMSAADANAASYTDIF